MGRQSLLQSSHFLVVSDRKCVASSTEGLSTYYCVILRAYGDILWSERQTVIEAPIDAFMWYYRRDSGQFRQQSHFKVIGKFAPKKCYSLSCSVQLFLFAPLTPPLIDSDSEWVVSVTVVKTNVLHGSRWQWMSQFSREWWVWWVRIIKFA